MEREIQLWCGCKAVYICIDESKPKRGGSTPISFVPLPDGYLDVESRIREE